MTITAQDLVAREVHYCVSGLISALAGVSGMSTSAIDANRDAWELFNAAFDLAAPIDDWEEAAIQAGYSVAQGGPYICDPNGDFVSDDEGTIDPTMDSAWRSVCDLRNIEPYQREVYEHWIVSDWLADKLEARGEKVDRDFAGMTIWARTTTGQAIYADGVMEDIAAEVNRA